MSKLGQRVMAYNDIVVTSVRRYGSYKITYRSTCWYLA